MHKISDYKYLKGDYRNFIRRQYGSWCSRKAWVCSFRRCL